MFRRRHDAVLPSPPIEASADTSALAGYVDALNSDHLRGWAWNALQRDRPIDIDIYVDNTLVRTVTADAYGADLKPAGIGDGYHRWACAISDIIVDDHPHEIAVRFSGTTLDLGGSPKRYLRGLLELVQNIEPQALASALYIRGEGIEIGALSRPLPVPANAKTLFVDRLSNEDLRRAYPEMSGYDLVPVSIVTDGETLVGVEDDSQDYVIASNFLEHCQDPIGTLKTFFRVLRPDGVVLVVVPNKRSNIDVRREPTTIEHLIEDHEVGAHVSRAQHYRDWARHVANLDDEDEITRKSDELMAEEYSIHFHVFTEFETVELFRTLHRRYHLPFVLEYVANSGCHETVVVARKT